MNAVLKTCIPVLVFLVFGFAIDASAQVNSSSSRRTGRPPAAGRSENKDQSGVPNVTSPSTGSPKDDSKDGGKEDKPLVKDSKKEEVPNEKKEEPADDTDDTDEDSEDDMDEEADEKPDDTPADGNRKPASKQGHWNIQSFDELAEKLPSGYKGVDMVKLCREIFIMDFKKEDVETKAEYKERMRAKVKEPFMNDLTLQSTMVVQYDTHVWYNADKETLFLGFPRISQYYSSDYSSKNIITMSIVLTSEDNRTYTGVNHFGVEVEVEETTLIEYTLVMAPFKVNRPKVNVASFDKKARCVPLKMKREEALKIKDKVACLVVFNLAPVMRPGEDNPFMTFDFFRKKPKLDSPTDIKARILGLIVKDVALWYYNIETGEIYLQMNMKKFAKKISQ